ncbi:MAG: hypothetical protein IPK21_21815 [Haliscomenobacter sp.]|nr:hypothetical protein [Haliscomenobacter sp.]
MIWLQLRPPGERRQFTRTAPNTACSPWCSYEVGHNFSCIVNSDERQWMDEGINLAGPLSRNGSAITDMTRKEYHLLYESDKSAEPHHDQPESIINFGSNAYGKPATAMNILRANRDGARTVRLRLPGIAAARRWAFSSNSC